MDATSAILPNSAVAQSGASAAQKQLAGNFDTFLTLLTTQLRSQDPLAPMDSNQFTQQLVQFSQVEQQIHSNKNFETLIGLIRAQSAANAVSYLGRTVTVSDGRAPLANGSATWSYDLVATAASTKLLVTDSQGRAVHTATGSTQAGANSFVWDGKNNAGVAQPLGTYTLNVVAVDGQNKTVSSSVSSQGVITEVDLKGSEPLLMAGPMSVPLSKATLISGQ